MPTTYGNLAHSLHEGMELRHGYVCIRDRALSEAPSTAGSMMDDSRSDTTDETSAHSPASKKTKLMSAWFKNSIF